MVPESNNDMVLPPNKVQTEFKKVDDVNSMLLDAIKAKLAILDH